MYGSQVREHFRYVEQNVCRIFSESYSAKRQHPLHGSFRLLS